MKLLPLCADTIFNFRVYTSSHTYRISYHIIYAMLFIHFISILLSNRDWSASRAKNFSIKNQKTKRMTSVNCSHSECCNGLKEGKWNSMLSIKQWDRQYWIGWLYVFHFCVETIHTLLHNLSLNGEMVKSAPLFQKPISI